MAHPKPITAEPTRTLVPNGDQWMLLLFWPNRRLVLTLDPVHEDADTWSLNVSRVDLDNPVPSLSSFLDDIQVDRLVSEADAQAKHLLTQPAWRASQANRQRMVGTRTSPDLIRQVAELRRTMSVIEIAREIGKSRNQVYRYLAAARAMGLDAEGVQ